MLLLLSLLFDSKEVGFLSLVEDDGTELLERPEPKSTTTNNKKSIINTEEWKEIVK